VVHGVEWAKHVDVLLLWGEKVRDRRGGGCAWCTHDFCYGLVTQTEGLDEVK
jgi:hypothetical protein